MSSGKRSLIINSVLIVVLLTVFAAPAAALSSTEIGYSLGAEKQLDRGNEILVLYTPGATQAEKNGAKNRAGALSFINKVDLKGDRDIYVYRAGGDPKSLVRKLKADKTVAAAAVNQKFKLNYTPNDPYFSAQWGLKNTGQRLYGMDAGGDPVNRAAGKVGADIDAVLGWNFERGYTNPTAAAVIDSGVDLAHPDLSANLWKNSGETPGNNIDDDGNGYVDDVNGYNFAGISQYFFNWIRPLTGSHYEFAQEIKGTGAPLTSVAFGIAREGTPTADLNLSVRGDLNGPDLAVAAIAPDEASTTLVWEERSLSAPVPMTAGKSYYLVVKHDAATVTVDNHFYIVDKQFPAGDTGLDSYKDGMEHWKVGINQWQAFPDYDLTFATNMNGIPRDDNGHGTHVAGIIGAAANNGKGVAGVAPGAKIMAIKAGDSTGGFYLDALLLAVKYAADNGARVINMSLGGGLDDDGRKLFQLAVNQAEAAGTVVVAAAGNTGDGSVSYPAGLENVIGVGATTNRDLRASFSTFNNTVDVAAPGDFIFSTIPTYPVALTGGEVNVSYAYLSGTSMASPMVSGLAALVLARRPWANPVQVQRLVEAGADDFGWPGYDYEFGHGRINIAKTLGIMLDMTAPSVKITTPLLATMTSADRRFKVSWSGSDPLPSAGIASYDVQYRVGAGGVWKNWIRNTNSTKRYFDNAAGGKTYYFKVRARDRVGNVSGWSSPVKTIVPYDNDGLVVARSGFNGVYSNISKPFYRGTIRYSARSGDQITLKFTGKKMYLIASTAPNRSKAKIYVDGVYQRTIDTYSSSSRWRKVVFSKAWSAKGTHRLKIVNLGTPGRRLFDIDALGVEN